MPHSEQQEEKGGVGGKLSQEAREPSKTECSLHRHFEFPVVGRQEEEKTVKRRRYGGLYNIKKKGRGGRKRTDTGEKKNITTGGKEGIN